MAHETIRREDQGDLTILRIGMVSIDAIAVGVIERSCVDMLPLTALDFAQVSFINSAGISALLKFVVAARQNGYKLFAINVSPHHETIFKMVEMSRFMPIVAERNLTAFSQPARS